MKRLSKAGIQRNEALASARYLLKQMCQEDSGQDLIEYALLLCVVAFVAAAVKPIGNILVVMFSIVGQTLTSVT